MESAPNEPAELLAETTRDMHRALISLREELEAIDWYQQRAEACADPSLRALFTHNGGEEVEHASMLVEWIRRHDARFGTMLKTYLFTEPPITSVEKAAAGAAPASPLPPAIGSMKRG